MTHQLGRHVDDRAKTVLIVDDHRAFSNLLALALAAEVDFEIVGKAATAGAAVEMATTLRPDMVVIDTQLGGQDGLEATRRIRDVLPDSIIVVISTHREPSWVAKSASAGASAFAPKVGSLTEMLSVLRLARADGMVVAPSVYRRADSPVRDELASRW